MSERVRVKRPRCATCLHAAPHREDGYCPTCGALGLCAPGRGNYVPWQPVSNFLEMTAQAEEAGE